MQANDGHLSPSPQSPSNGENLHNTLSVYTTLLFQAYLDSLNHQEQLIDAVNFHLHLRKLLLKVFTLANKLTALTLKLL